MHFLITGGCGYIGTKLTQHLLLKKNKLQLSIIVGLEISIEKIRTLKL